MRGSLVSCTCPLVVAVVSRGHVASTMTGSIGVEVGGSSTVIQTSASEMSVSVSTTITMATGEADAVVNNDMILVGLA